MRTYDDEVGEENEKPAWSPISNQIAFITKVESFKEKMVILNLDNSQISSLTKPKQFEFYRRIEWSPNGEYLAFDVFIPHSKGNTGVAVMNVESKTARIISDVNMSCALGGWTLDGAKLIFNYYHESSIKESGFYEYVIETGEVKLIVKFENVSCNDAQVRSNGHEIVFTKYDWQSDSYDIWLYNILDYTSFRMTTDGHEKDGLRVYMKH